LYAFCQAEITLDINFVLEITLYRLVKIISVMAIILVQKISAEVRINKTAKFSMFLPREIKIVPICIQHFSREVL
jgi:hypothetical protein